MLEDTAERASEELGFTVADVYIRIAKCIIAGFSPEKIGDIYGVPTEEVIELLREEEYCKVYSWLAKEETQRALQTDEAYDAIEAVATNKLVKTAQVTQDPDLLMKLTMIANKAERKGKRRNAGVLADPEAGSGKVTIQLTSRMIQGFLGAAAAPIARQDSPVAPGPIAEERTAQITFEQASTKDVSNLLGVKLNESADEIENKRAAKRNELGDSTLAILEGLTRD